MDARLGFCTPAGPLASAVYMVNDAL